MEVLAALVVPLFAALAVLWIGLNLSQRHTRHHDSRPSAERLTPPGFPDAPPDLQHPQRACDQGDRQTQRGRGQ